MNHLTETFGLLSEDVARDFEAIDKNGDGLVSKQECVKAYDILGLDLDRSKGNGNKKKCPKDYKRVCGVNGLTYSNQCLLEIAGIVTMKLRPNIQFSEKVKFKKF